MTLRMKPGMPVTQSRTFEGATSSVDLMSGGLQSSTGKAFYTSYTEEMIPWACPAFSVVIYMFSMSTSLCCVL